MNLLGRCCLHLQGIRDTCRSHSPDDIRFHSDSRGKFMVQLLQNVLTEILADIVLQT
jgi:hypothetical protein